VECPVSRYSNLIWVGFSDEGQLFTYDSEGMVRGLSMGQENWAPVLDFRAKCPKTYSQQWVVGICDMSIFCIELARDYKVPHLHQRSQIKGHAFTMPFLNLPEKKGGEDTSLPLLEENHSREVFVLDQKNFRMNEWLPYKEHRSHQDNEYILSESVPDTT